MDARTMPTATFRCDVCGLQESERLTKHLRRTDREDVTVPHPHHHGQPMELVQVQYADAVAV